MQEMLFWLIIYNFKDISKSRDSSTRGGARDEATV